MHQVMNQSLPDHGCKGFVDNSYMDWPTNSCDLNPIENLLQPVTPVTIANLTSFVDNRLFRVIEKKGASVQ